MVRWKKTWLFGGCSEIVFWLHTAKNKNPDTPQTHPSAYEMHEWHSDTSRHPQTSPRHSQGLSREHDMPTIANRHRQTLPDTARHWQVLLEYVWGCRLASLVVCLHVMFLGDVWGCLWDVWGCLGDIWGVSGGTWVAFMEIVGAWMCLGGILVPIPCSMEPKHYFGTSLKGMTFFHLTILRH